MIYACENLFFARHSILAELPHSPFSEVSDYFIIANVTPVAIEVGYIEFRHVPCSDGYHFVSNLF